MIWYIIRIYFCNISIRLFPKVRKIGLLAVFIPFIRIYTMPSGIFIRYTHSSNTCKQINK